MAENSANTVFSPSKRPQRGILKNSTSLDRPSEGKIATFDEMNILATYHPENKDYGHMKIDEPKTPYGGRVCPQCKAQREALERSGSVGNYVECHHEQDSVLSGDEAEHNTNRLTNVAAELQRRFSAESAPEGNFQGCRRSSFDQNVMGGYSSDEDESEMTEEQKAHRRAFQERRKMHYNEFEKVRLARQLIEKEESDDEEEANTSKPNPEPDEGDNEDEDEDVAMQDAEATGDHEERVAVHFSNDDENV